MGVSARIGVFASLMWLVACSETTPNAPFCRYSEALSPASKAITGFANQQPSACLIRDGRYLLVVIHRLSNKYDLPSGQANEGESAACTAHRETFEETGLNVKVIQYVGQSNSGLQFFHCEQEAGFNAPDVAPPSPFWQSHEIKQVLWVDPYEINHKDWRFAEQLVEVRAAFVNP